MDRWLQFALLSCLSLGVRGEDGGEEEETPKADIMVAAMLLASVTYMMFTLGMANQKRDRALQKLVWTALNTKISIFCAVLLYQGVIALCGWHGHRGVEDGTLRQVISAGVGWFWWFAMLQGLMASLSFAMFSKKVWQKHGEEEEAWTERREVLMAFWGVLLGHITGFASINFWAQMQLLLYTWAQTKGAFAIVFIAIFTQMGWVIFVRKTRREIVWKYDPNAGADGASKAARKALDRWNEKTIETENDSIALTLSFVIVQAFRVFVSGVMPDPEGLEERGGPADTGPLDHTHTWFECGHLLFWGLVVFSAVLLWRDWKVLAPCKDRLDKFCHNNDIDFERMTEVASDTGSMVLAWTLFFFSYWFLDTFNQDVCRAGSSNQTVSTGAGVNCGSGGMTGGVLLAMCTTVMSYSTIYVFRRTALHINDFALSNHHQQKTAHDIILSVMKASGLLIGFGWEKAFDKAVEDLSEQAPYPGVSQFFMSLFVFAVVGYIWMWYILPEVMEYEEDDDTKRELKEKFKVKYHEEEGAHVGALQKFMGSKKEAKKEGPEGNSALQGFLKGRKKNKIEEAKEEFEDDLKAMQAEFEEAVAITSQHFQTLREKEYPEEKDENGRPINSGKSRADHKVHMRHLLRLQHEAATYKTTGGDLFRSRTSQLDQQTSASTPRTSASAPQRAAAAPYLVNKPKP